MIEQHVNVWKNLKNCSWPYLCQSKTNPNICVSCSPFVISRILRIHFVNSKNKKTGSRYRGGNISEGNLQALRGSLTYIMCRAVERGGCKRFRRSVSITARMAVTALPTRPPEDGRLTRETAYALQYTHSQ